MGGVAREHLLKRDERLDLDALIDTVEQKGKVAKVIPDPDEMAAEVAHGAQPGDVVAILSNGGFGGVHQKILLALDDRFS